jgi:hypothetical protein
MSYWGSMCSRCYSAPCVCSYKTGWPVIHEQIVPNTIPTYPVDYPMITFDPLSLAKMENDALRAENEALRQRVAALEKQLGR